MAQLTYVTGQLIDFGLTAHDEVSKSNVGDLCPSNVYTHQSPASQTAFLPGYRFIHDSVYSLSSSQLSNFAALQQYEADGQPNAKELSPHSNISHSHRSVDMSRENSYASFQSSVSSGRQYHGGQAINTHGNGLPSTGTEMRRTVSMYTDISAPQIRANSDYSCVDSDHLHPSLARVHPQIFTAVPAYASHLTASEDLVSANNSFSTIVTDRDYLEFGIGVHDLG